MSDDGGAAISQRMAGVKSGGGGIAALTGIRGIAATWVLIFHVQGFAWNLGAPQLGDLPFLRDGWIAVDLFFLLSGFILMYAHEADFHRFSARKFFEFMWLRFFRIYPLATVVLCIIVVLVALDPGFVQWYRHVHSPNDLTLVPFIKTLLLATRWMPPYDGDWNQPVWSLSVEILGYCALPFLALWLTRWTSPVLLLVAAVCCIAAPLAVSVVTHNPHINGIDTWAIVRMAACFSGGVALCRAWRLLPRFDPQLAAMGAGLSVLAVLALAWVPFGFALMDLAFGALIFCLAYQHGAISRLLSGRTAMFLGQISFPLYLLHVMPLLILVSFLDAHRPGVVVSMAMLAALLVTIFASSYVLHLLIERPSHRWARRRLANMARSDAVVPAAELEPTAGAR